jgi:hypothetical protein
MRARPLFALLGLVVALALPASAAAQPLLRSAQAAGEGEWSAERMAAAPPIELVRAGDGEVRLRRARDIPFTSVEVPDPATPPNAVNGRLFGHLDGFGDFSCSATVLDSANGRVIMTAGHCVYDPQLGRFARQLSFVPAYDDGATPFGQWQWTSLITTRPWVRGNSNFDYAAIKLAKVNGQPVEAVVGGRALKTNVARRQPYSAFGYPANLGGGENMWTCSSGYAGRDPRPFGQGKAAIAMGCDMKQGASGGGWINGAGYLVSVTSFGYENQPNLVYGPYLTVSARKLVKRLGRR